MKSNIEQGEIGEQIAITYLIKKGFNLLEKNWRNSKGEIDIIMSKDNIIVFVEVKLRKTDTFGDPEKSVTKSKQKRIIQTANSYIASKKPLTQKTLIFLTKTSQNDLSIDLILSLSSKTIILYL